MVELLITLVGLCVGSFANVCIYRLPRHESVVTPRSHCVACGHSLAPYDLIPVVSYFALRGRCRYCGARISPRYPLVELLTGLLFLAAYRLLGLTWDLAAAWLTIVVAVIAFATDIEHRIIPNALTFPAVAAGLLLSLAAGRFIGALLGTLICGGAFMLIGLLGAGKLGGGDVKLAAAIGAMLGLRAGVTALLLGVIAGALIGLTLIALGRATLKSYIPFAPPLTAAAVAVALAWPALAPFIGTWLGW